MARQKLVAIVVSAVCFAVFAVVTVKGMAARERRWFEASRALLDAGAQLMTSELGTFGRDLPEIADHIALDPDLGQQLHLLSGQLAALAAMPKPGERIKQTVLAQNAKVNERLSTLRGDLQVDGIALLDEQGLVLLSDTPLMALSDRVRMPPPEGTTAVTPAPVPDDPKTETVRNAVSGPSLGAAVLDGTIFHVGAAPIMIKNKLAGVVVVERRLKALPKPTGVDPVLSLGGQVRLGRAPEGANVEGNSDVSAFLLAPREVRSIIPNIGPVAHGPLFVDAGTMGVWARRFEIPRVPSAVGYVYTDLTPAYAELGGLQLMTVFLATAVFLIHALLIITDGLGVARGIAHISDFIGKHQQGKADAARLAERNLPSSLHRLARLVNVLLEKGGAPQPRNTSLDDVIAHHAPATAVPEVGELDFGSFAGGASAAPATATPAAKPAPASAPLAGPPSSSIPFPPATQPAPTTTAPAPAAAGAAPAEAPVAAPASASAPPATAVMAAKPATVAMDKSSAAILATLEEMSVVPLDDEGIGEPEATFHQVEAEAEPTAMNGTPAAAAATSAANGSSQEKHYRDVFQRFILVRAECGESTDDLTYDRFLVKLGQSRDAVMSKHTCSDVRFAVYVKNGKAALKATPVK